MNAMTPQLDCFAVVVHDMAASLAFYRALGLDIPAEADGEPHAEVTLAGGVRLCWDTTETLPLGNACVWTARYETPRKSEIEMTPRTISV